MVLLGRAMICYQVCMYIQTTVWQQFAMQVLTRVVSPSLGGELELGPLSSPVVTCRLPIVNIGLSLTVVAMLRLVTTRTDGRTELV